MTDGRGGVTLGPRDDDMSTANERSRALARTVDALFFPGGIPGFPDHERFALVDLVEDGAFQRLQSLDDPDMSMIVCVPWLFFPGYSLELGIAEQQELNIVEPGDAAVFCPVIIDPDEDQVYLNLLGPFIVNTATREGRQLVLAGSGYSARESVALAAL